MSTSVRSSGPTGPWRSYPALLVALPVALFLAGCSPSGGTDLLVLGPSSLTDALPRAARGWEDARGGGIRFGFDATSRLAPQLNRGAPADLFISADEAWMEWAERRELVDPATRVELAGNELVLVVPADREAPVPRDLEALAGGDGHGRLALAGENVPAARYARAGLERAGVWTAVRDRIIRGGSVRGTLEWVAANEVDAGVVYRTDALVEPRVRIAFAFPSGPETRVTYHGAVVAGSPRAREARTLLDHLAGTDAGRILRAEGFVLPEGEPISEASTAPPTREAPADPASAIRLSLVVALAATLLGLVPAVALGWVLARKHFPGKSALSTAVMVPLVLPPVVTGFVLLTLLGRSSPLGAFLADLGMPVPFTILGAVVAALVVGLPLYVVAIRGAFEAVDPRLEEVSWTLGRPPASTFRQVTLPLALPGIAAGAVLAFARALGEFGATVVLAGNVEGSTRTIALAVYTLLEAPGGAKATWILVGASVALSALALLGYEILSRRQRRRVVDR